MPRYQKISGKGLYKDTSAGTYYAVKYVDGKKFSKTFNALPQARKWRDSPTSHKIDVSINYDGELNGSKLHSFKEAWEKYQKLVFPRLEESSIQVKKERSKFFDDLMEVKMVYINPDFIDDYILKKKEQIIKTMKKNRYNLDHELVELRAVFNFYHENVDFKFICPVIKARHFPLGIIRTPPDRNKKMGPEEISLFFSRMRMINKQGGVYADLAEIQFWFAGRVSEAAAIRDVSINEVGRILTVDKAISWNIRDKSFRALKGTKTGKTRFSHITDRMLLIFKKRMSVMSPGCPYLFHLNGIPLNYSEIYKAYQAGLKASGLDKKYSATHIMRHSMAKQARVATGSLDGAQAMGGWASIKQCEDYADSPSHMQIEAVGKVEERLKLVK